MKKEIIYTKIDLCLVTIIIFTFGTLLLILNIASVHYLLYTILSLMFSAIIIITVKCRHQSLDSIGFTKDIIPLVILVLITITISIYAFYSNNCKLIVRWIFNVVVVSFLEELMFRGFAHIRVQFFLQSNIKTVILLGLVFGSFHGFNKINDVEYPVLNVFSEMGGGIIGHGFFYYIYYKSNSIWYPIIIHAILGILPLL